MNIHLLTQAVENIDAAVIWTMDSNERGLLKSMSRRLRRMLRKHGVFLGRPEWQNEQTKKG